LLLAQCLRIYTVDQSTHLMEGNLKNITSIQPSSAQFIPHRVHELRRRHQNAFFYEYLLILANVGRLKGPYTRHIQRGFEPAFL
jgi:hypothetical protein